MKKILFIALIPLLFLTGCPQDDTSTYYAIMYEFAVENRLGSKTVEIVPTSTNRHFWITSDRSYTVIPGGNIIIGSRITYNDHQTASDIYLPDDTIEPFDLYIDGEKQEKNVSLRKFWNFSPGRTNQSASYTLIVNEELLKQ